MMRYNPFTDYDKHGCLKLPLLMYLALAYLLKGYVIWIVSLSYRQEPAALLNVFYPSRSDFYGALFVGVPALVCAVLFSLRRVNMPKVVEQGWLNIRALMVISAGVQLSYSVWMGNVSWHNIRHISSNWGGLLDVFIVAIISVYCLLNQYVIDVSRQFPQEQES